MSRERDGRSGEESQSLGGEGGWAKGATIMLRMGGGGGAILPTQAACSLFGASAFGNRWYTGADGNGLGGGGTDSSN